MSTLLWWPIKYIWQSQINSAKNCTENASYTTQNTGLCIFMLTHMLRFRPLWFWVTGLKPQWQLTFLNIQPMCCLLPGGAPRNPTFQTTLVQPVLGGKTPVHYKYYIIYFNSWYAIYLVIATSMSKAWGKWTFYIEWLDLGFYWGPYFLWLYKVCLVFCFSGHC